MIQIMVDAALAQQIAESKEPIVLIGPSGQQLGQIKRPLISAEALAVAEKRLFEPSRWLTTEQVLASILTARA